MSLIKSAELVVDGYLNSDLTYDEIAELIKAIEEEKNKPEIICGWTLEDMYTAGEGLGISLTKEQAEELFNSVENSFDASVGMTWDLIEELLEEILNEE